MARHSELMAKSNRYKELRKLVDAGYPLYSGIGFMLAAVYALVKLGTRLFRGSESSHEIGLGAILAISGLVTLAILIGAALIKVGMETKDQEKRRRD